MPKIKKQINAHLQTITITKDTHWQLKKLCVEKKLKFGEQADKILALWVAKNTNQSKSAKVG